MRPVRHRIVVTETVDLSLHSHLGGQLRAWTEAGFEVVACAADTGGLARFGHQEGVAVEAVPLARQPAPLRDLRGLLHLVRLHRRLRPGTAVYGTPKAGLLAALAARAAGVPVRVYVLHGLRLETLHGPARRVAGLLERLVTRLSTHTVAVSDSLRRAVTTELGLPPGTVTVLGDGSANGVDLDRFAPLPPAERTAVRRDLGVSDVVFLLLFVGRVHPDKGVRELLDAVRAVRRDLPEVVLVTAGTVEGDEEFRREFTAAREAGDVVHLGPRDDVAALLGTADALVLPTHREGLPTVLLEAASCGTPVVATRATGVVDVLDDDTAALSDVGDATALARSIAATVADPEAAANRARGARESVAARFAHPDVRDRWVRFLQEVSGVAPVRPRPLRVLWLTKGLARGGVETLLVELAAADELADVEVEVASVLGGAGTSPMSVTGSRGSSQSSSHLDRRALSSVEVRGRPRPSLETSGGVSGTSPTSVTGSRGSSQGSSHLDRRALSSVEVRGRPRPSLETSGGSSQNSSDLDRREELATELIDDLERQGVRVHLLGARRSAQLGWALRLARLVRSGRYDVVHSHSPLPAIVARVAAVGTRTALVTTEHSSRELYHPLTRALNDATARLDDARFAVSKVSAASFPARGGTPVLAVRHGRRVAAPSGSPTALRHALGLRREDLVVLSTGNLRPEKSLHVLLAALATLVDRHPRLRLVVVGDGVERTALERQVAAGPLAGRTVFTGAVPDGRSLLAVADVFAMSSRFEGLPLTVMEALQAGVPVVSTDVGGIPELVEHGRSGLLVPAGDVGELAGALDAVLASRELRSWLADGARRAGRDIGVGPAAAVYRDCYRVLAERRPVAVRGAS